VQLAINATIELLIPTGVLRELEVVLLREGVIGDVAPRVISEKLLMFAVEDGDEQRAVRFTTDPRDRFVAATAIEQGATYLLTYNTKDFDLTQTSADCVTPDFLLAQLLDERPNEVIKAVRQVRERYRNPSIETAQFLAVLENLRLKDFACSLRTMLRPEL
jgi:predicted nucleic acid-binding protein